MTQRIELADLALLIDGPGLDCELSGWFGGFGAENAMAHLTATFLDSNSVAITSSSIGDVTAAERTNATALLRRSYSGGVPAGTRFVEFSLSNDNNAVSDEVSFVLTARQSLPVTIEDIRVLPNGVQVRFSAAAGAVYTLERTEDFQHWTMIDESQSLTLGSMNLSDTNAPQPAAFYRVSGQVSR